MAKLMWIAGVLLVAAGIVFTLLIYLATGKMSAYQLYPDTAAIVLVGGILSLGIGSVIEGLKSGLRTSSVESAAFQKADNPLTGDDTTPVQMPTRFGRKAAEATAASAAITSVGAVIASETVAKAVDTSKSSVADTLAALDEAKADIKKALGGMDSLTSAQDTSHPVPAASPAPASAIVVPAVTAEPEADAEADPNLFVVEEKIIRGRPARVLSDETVEAETDEGWMRFENLEHLNEYLDSVEEPET